MGELVKLEYLSAHALCVLHLFAFLSLLALKSQDAHTAAIWIVIEWRKWQMAAVMAVLQLQTIDTAKSVAMDASMTWKRSAQMYRRQFHHQSMQDRISSAE